MKLQSDVDTLKDKNNVCTLDWGIQIQGVTMDRAIQMMTANGKMQIQGCR